MKTDLKAFYANEAPVYHDRRYQTRYGRLFAKLHHEAISKLVETQPRGTKVLEVACGTGHTTHLLTSLGLDVTACDLTPEMMSQAKERIRKDHLATKPYFVLSEAQRLPFANGQFDLVISTRFLHLFPYDRQGFLLGEMLRVLKPGGDILVDFDNWVSRWFLAIPYAAYNLLNYHRLAPYSIYNRIGQIRRLMSRHGVKISEIVGVGGTHLIVPCWFSPDLAMKWGRWHRRPGLRLLAEQLMVLGTKE